MSEQYNIIYNDEELNNNQNKENITKTTLQMSEELSDNLKTMNLDNQNNEEEKQKLKPFNPQKDIKILKEKYRENNENECKVNNEKEDLERNLKSYMIANKSKEDKILDLLEIINQYEIQISLLNKQIINLTNSNKQMKGIIKNIEYGYEQTKVNLMTEKEVNKNNNTYLNNLYQDKILSEERIKELINIINQYSTEIDSITNTLNILKNENLKYKKENEEYKNNIFKLTEKANTLEYDMNTIKNDNTKLYEEVCRLKEDNEKLCELQYNTENKGKELIDENENLKIQIKNEENKNISLIKSINQDLESLAKYFDMKYNNLFNEESYLQTISNNNDDEMKLSLICFQNIEENNIKDLNIELLIKTLINGFNCSKDKIKELINQNRNISENKEKKYQEMIEKEKEYIQQIEKFKESITQKDKIISQFNSEIVELKKLKEEKIEDEDEDDDDDDNDNNNLEIQNNSLNLEKKIEFLNNEIILKEVQIENVNKLLKKRDDDIVKLKEDNKKLIQDNVNLIKGLKKFNKK